jgi:hypothetical protein
LVLVEATRCPGFRLADASFAALRAGAFPAVERFVAGFNRVDFFAANTRLREAAGACREVEREEDLFVVVLMRWSSVLGQDT